MLNWERQRPLSTLPTQSIPPLNPVQPVDKGLPTHPITKHRIGQGKAGLRRKFRTAKPIPLPNQMACSTNDQHMFQRQHCHCLSL